MHGRHNKSSQLHLKKEAKVERNMTHVLCDHRSRQIVPERGVGRHKSYHYIDSVH
jgi:hypothetical protein